MKFLLQGIFVGFLILIDRVTKTFALTMTKTLVLVNPFVSLEPCLNKGISWGLFSFANDLYQVILTVLIIVLLSLVVILGRSAYINRQDILPYLLIFAGGLSNVYDRIVHKGVIDFISFDCSLIFFDLTFNIADIMILVGLAFLVLQGTYREDN